MPVSVIDSQARAMGIPLMTRNASWEGYEGQFKDALDELKKLGITHGVFGDIDLEGHREWVERVTLEKGMKAALPLWKMGRRELLAEFFAMGFEARIVSVKDGVLDKSYLGKELTPSVVSEIEAIGIDAAGENGEYHTVVTDGPMFSYPIRLDSKEIVSRDGYHFLSVIES